MRKRNLIKIAAFVIMAILLVSVTSCGQKSTTSEDEGAKSDKIADKEQKKDKKTEKEEVEEPIEMSIWAPAGRFTPEDRLDKVDYDKDFGFLEDKFNIKLKFVQVPSEQARDQIGIMLATNDLTDMIHITSSYDTFLVRPDQLLADGQIIDLKSIEESIPNFMKIVNENPVIMKNVMNDNGNILYFGVPIFEQEIAMSGGLMIRKDWLDKFDLDLPQSLEEFIQALRIFRDEDPNENGENDEVPFCGNEGSLQVIGNLTGVQETFSMVGGAGGDVVFGPFEEEAYKKRLKLIAQFAQEKLINENYYNFDFDMRDTWIAEDKVGASLTGLGNLDKWNALMADHETFLMWPIDNPRQEDGNRYFDRTSMSKGMEDNVTVITTSAKHPEKCGEFLDYFYTDEGHNLKTFGVEGITYNMEDGFPKFTELITDNPDDLGVGDARGKYIGIPGTVTHEDLRVWAQLSLTTPGSRQASMRTWTDTFTSDTNTPIPPAMMTEEAADEYSDIMADLQTYILESVAKFTTGDWDVDADYDQFVETCKTHGAERALELLDEAVKAWQARGDVPYEFTLGRANIDYWDKIPLKTEKGIECMDPSLK
ncbi:MAG: extracellular solute-binding protein [Clostridiales bacterium]|nr:extracellular solute-binding protein [Clostridiales bacterium]